MRCSMRALAVAKEQELLWAIFFAWSLMILVEASDGVPRESKANGWKMKGEGVCVACVWREYNVGRSGCRQIRS